MLNAAENGGALLSACWSTRRRPLFANSIFGFPPIAIPQSSSTTQAQHAHHKHTHFIKVLAMLWSDLDVEAPWRAARTYDA